jgi:lipid II:glycine glycyltransferase (peptidoglycan interpeptide bridge formation enzyme)
MSIRILTTITEEDFDQYTVHPMQSFAWGTIREKTGLEVVRFGVYKDDALIEVYEMTLHHVPYVPYRIGYIPRSRVPSEEFVTYLKEYSKTNRVVYVKFEPQALVSESDMPRGLIKSKSPLFYTYSRVIDTTLPIETLKKGLESGTRYNIGLAERKSVIVTSEDTEQGFETFYAMYESTTKRQHFGGHTRSYHKTIWDAFGSKGIAHILVARYGEEALAACEVWLYKGTLYYTYAGSSNEHRNLKPMNALLWHVILFAKQVGASKVDLWGILPPGEEADVANPWAGFSDFKKGYGGTVIEMCGSYDLVVFPVWYKLISLGMRIRKKFIYTK